MSLGDFKKIAGQPVILTGTIPPSSTGGPSVNQTLKNIRLPIDEEGNLLAIPVFMFGANGNNAIATIRNGNNPLAQLMGADNTLSVTNLQFLFNQGAGSYDVVEEATSFVAGSAASGATNNLLATGGAGKKYKIFGVMISASSSAAVANPAATIQEHTSTTTIASLSLDVASSAAIYIPFGNNGLLQPTANNGIDLVNQASVISDAVLIYGAAR